MLPTYIDKETDMLKQMWKYLIGVKAMHPETIAMPIAKTMLHPATKCCPICGAGISQIALISGGIVGRGKWQRVKAKLKCRSCGGHEAFAGTTAYHRGVVLILINQPRRRPGEHGQIWNNANVV
jgi:hypothetical protein